jgi:hypothetical protein
LGAVWERGWGEEMWVSIRAMAMKRRMLDGRTSSRSYRPLLPCRFKRAWVLTILFTYRSCTHYPGPYRHVIRQFCI